LVDNYQLYFTHESLFFATDALITQILSFHNFS